MLVHVIRFAGLENIGIRRNGVCNGGGFEFNVGFAQRIYFLLQFLQFFPDGVMAGTAGLERSVPGREAAGDILGRTVSSDPLEKPETDFSVAALRVDVMSLDFPCACATPWKASINRKRKKKVFLIRISYQSLSA